jgi:hypothetical protein
LPDVNITSGDGDEPSETGGTNGDGDAPMEGDGDGDDTSGPDQGGTSDPLSPVGPLGAATDSGDLQGYFVDSVDGDDESEGTSPDAPWKTVDKISALTLAPGDHVYFKRGSSFTEGLQINGDGTAEDRILVGAYGEGAPPEFTNTDDGDYAGNAIQLNGDYQTVENLRVYGTNPAAEGDFLTVWAVGAIKANLGADHAIIRHNEVEDAPIGINSNSDGALITKNHVHDCNRELNPPNWGPLGVRIGIGNTEISYNTIHNVHSIGGTWGGDGGAIEVDDGRNHHRNISIHHNKSSLNMGFLEMSYGFDICDPSHEDLMQAACDAGDCRPCETDNRIFHNTLIAYNEASDYRTFTQIWGPLRDTFIENNTIVRTVEHPEIESNVFAEFDPDKLGNETTYRNNLVVVVTEPTRDGVNENRVYLGYPMAPFLHSNNLFFNLEGEAVVLNGAMSGIPANNPEYAEGELFVDPLLMNIDGGDYRLSDSSPAIGQGVATGSGFNLDLAGNPIADPPSIGAYEPTP